MASRDDYRRSSGDRDRDRDRDRRPWDRRRDRDHSSGGGGGRRRYHNDEDNDDDSGSRHNHSRSRYNREYESRKFRDRRDRYFSDKYERRSRDRDYDYNDGERSESSRRHDRDNNLERENEFFSRRPKQEDSSSDHENTNEEYQVQNTATAEYLSKFSDAKLQETYEKYENDPDFDITDGLLDNIVIDKEKIHKEMQERLRQHLASEGKVYPPPKPEPTQTMFANDGSFMDMFKRMQEAATSTATAGCGGAGGSGTAAALAAGGTKPEPVVRKPAPPIYGKRRGGKILKTGIVEKKKPIEDLSAETSGTDAWSLYMKEVKRYKAVSCDVDNKTRPLVK